MRLFSVGAGILQAAQIEDLVVGGNVAMGSYATMSWSNITGTDAHIAWNNVTSKPNFSDVAMSGDYDDLDNLDTIML